MQNNIAMNSLGEIYVEINNWFYRICSAWFVCNF